MNINPMFSAYQGRSLWLESTVLCCTRPRSRLQKEAKINIRRQWRSKGGPGCRGPRVAPSGGRHLADKN